MSLSQEAVTMSMSATCSAGGRTATLWRLCIVAALLPLALPYRMHDPNTGPPTAAANFSVYDPGFVGRVADPVNPRRFRVNEGNPFSLAQPNIFRGVLPRQNCPAMVGPIDGVFYCSRQEAGYCDRRSGACFCFPGYQGTDCGRCRSSHARDPEDGLCKKRVLCPNDCSGAGTCNVTTGTCTCERGRRGLDCSLSYCRTLHRWCTSCDSTECVACEQGWFVDPATGGCAPCTVHDPRCYECNAQECLSCADPLLTSVRRSGRRRVDPPLPFDEDSRQLSYTLPFGTQSSAAFADAESFVVISDAAAVTDAGVVHVEGVTPADACYAAAGVRTAQQQSTGGPMSGLIVTLSMVSGADVSSGDGGAVIRRYRIDCSLLAYADPYYGYGAAGRGLEGPVQGAFVGSPLSPHVYPPGAVLQPDGSVVDVTAALLQGAGSINSTGPPLPSELLTAGLVAPNNAPNSSVPLIVAHAAAEISPADGGAMQDAIRRGARITPPLPSLLLNASALACEQGYDAVDEGMWHCKHVRQSHVVCGHAGTLSFASPTYAVVEGDGYVSVTVTRSGGGLGRVSVGLQLEHVTTDDSDVSLASPWGTTSSLVFEPGVVSLTFRITVHDDAVIEPYGTAARSNFTAVLVAKQAFQAALDAQAALLAANSSSTAGKAYPTATNAAEVAAVAASQGGLDTLWRRDSSGAAVTLPGGSTTPQQARRLQSLMTATAAAANVELYNCSGTPATEAGYPSVGSVDWHARLSPHETFRLRLVDVTGGAVLGAQSETTVAILDDDAFAVSAVMSTGVGITTRPPLPSLLLDAVTARSAAATRDPDHADAAHAAHYNVAGATTAALFTPRDAVGGRVVRGRAVELHTDSSFAPGLRLVSTSAEEQFLLSVSSVPSGTVQQAITQLRRAVAYDLEVHGGAAGGGAVRSTLRDATGAIAQGSLPTAGNRIPPAASITATSATSHTVIYADDDGEMSGGEVEQEDASFALYPPVPGATQLDAAVTALTDAQILSEYLRLIQIGSPTTDLATAISDMLGSVLTGYHLDPTAAAEEPGSNPGTEAGALLTTLHTHLLALAGGVTWEGTAVQYVDGLGMTNGTYRATVTPTTAGLHLTQLLHAKPGGLQAEYFGNPFLRGQPLLRRVDGTVNFAWGVGPVFSVSGCTACGGSDTDRLSSDIPAAYTPASAISAAANQAQPGGCMMTGPGASDFAGNMSASSVVGSLRAQAAARQTAAAAGSSGAAVPSLAEELVSQTRSLLGLDAPSGTEVGADGSSSSSVGQSHSCTTGAWSDAVSVRWSGRIGVGPHGEEGQYWLVLFADEHVRLWFDDELLIDAWGATDLMVSSEGESDIGSGSGSGSTGAPVQLSASGNVSAPYPRDRSDTDPTLISKRRDRFEVQPSSIQLPGTATPLTPGSSSVPQFSAGRATTMCTFGRFTGGSSNLPTETAAAVDADVLCVDATPAAALSPVAGFSARDRVMNTPTEQQGYLNRVHGQLQDILADIRAVGGTHAADTAWMGLRVPVTLKAGQLHRLVIEYRDVAGWASCRLAWITPAMLRAAATAASVPLASADPVALSIQPVTVPRSVLYSTRHLSGSPTLTYLQPASLWATGAVVNVSAAGALGTDGYLARPRNVADMLSLRNTSLLGAAAPLPASQLLIEGPHAVVKGSVAIGAGLHSSTVGQASSFAVYPRDAYGNARGGAAASDDWIVQAMLLWQEPNLAARVSTTTVSSTIGNAAGNVSQHSLTVQAAGGAAPLPVAGRARYNRTTGAFDVQWETTVSGLYAVSVLGQTDWRVFTHVHGSPFPALVAPVGLSPQRTVVTGAGVQPTARGVVTGNPHVLLVQPRDVYGNSLILRTAISNTTLADPAESATWDAASQLLTVHANVSDSRYPVVLHHPETVLPALYRVAVRAFHATAPRSDPAVVVDPVLVAVLLPLSADGGWNSTVITVDGANVTLYADSTLLSAPNASFCAALGIDRQQLRALAFVAVWRPSLAGPYYVSVTTAASAAHVAASPYPVIVAPGLTHGPSSTMMWAPVQSTAYPAQFVLTLRDRFSNKRTPPGASDLPVSTAAANWAAIAATAPPASYYINAAQDAVMAWVESVVYNISGPSYSVRNASVQYTGSSAAYRITSPCAGLLCKLHVYAAGQPVLGSPFVYSRPAGNATAATSNSWSLPIGAAAGAATPAWTLLQLRDADGNVLRGANVTDLISKGLVTITVRRLGGLRPDAVEDHRTWQWYSGASPVGALAPDATWPLPTPVLPLTTTYAHRELVEGIGALLDLPRLHQLPVTSVVAATLAQAAAAAGGSGSSIGASWPDTPLPSIHLPAVVPLARAANLSSSWVIYPSLLQQNLSGAASARDGARSWGVTVTDGDEEDVWLGWNGVAGKNATSAVIPLFNGTNVTLTSDYGNLTSTAIRITPVSGADGLVLITWHTARAGLWEVAVRVAGTQHAQPQHVVAILPTTMSAKASDVVGNATSGCVAGRGCVAAVVARDAYGNRVARAGAHSHLLSAVLVPVVDSFGRAVSPDAQVSAALALTPAPVPDAAGVWRVDYTPRVAGRSELRVGLLQHGSVHATYTQMMHTSTDGTVSMRMPSSSPVLRTSTSSLGLQWNASSLQAASRSGDAAAAFLSRTATWTAQWHGFFRIPTAAEVATATTFSVPLPGAAAAAGADGETQEVEEVQLLIRHTGGAVKVAVHAQGKHSVDGWTAQGVADDAESGRSFNSSAWKTVLDVRAAGGTASITPVTLHLTRGQFYGLAAVYVRGPSPDPQPCGGGCELSMRVLSKSMNIQALALDAAPGIPLLQPGASLPAGTSLRAESVLYSGNASAWDLDISLASPLLYAPAVDAVAFSPYSVTVAPAEAFAPACQLAFQPQPGVPQEPLAVAARAASGSGFETAVTGYGLFDVAVAAGNTASFTVTVMDEQGNGRGLSDEAKNDTVLVWAQQLYAGGAFVPPSAFAASYIGNSTWSVRYMPTGAAGAWSLWVAVNPPPAAYGESAGPYSMATAANATLSLLGMRPYRVYVAAAPVAVDVVYGSRVWGDGLTHATSTAPAVFYTQLVDAAGNNVTAGDDCTSGVCAPTVTFTWYAPLGGQVDSQGAWSPSSPVKLVPPAVGSALTPAPTGIAATVQPATGSGLYTVHYTASASGLYRVTVAVAGVAVAGSPFTLTVLPAPAAAATSSIEKQSNSRWNSTNALRLLFNDALSNADVAQQVADAATLPVRRNAAILYLSTAVTTTSAPAGSAAADLPTADASSVRAEILSALHPQTGASVSFNVRLRDRYGAPLRVGGQGLYVQLRRASTASEGPWRNPRGWVKDSGNGLHVVTLSLPNATASSYAPLLRGPWLLDVLLLSPTQAASVPEGVPVSAPITQHGFALSLWRRTDAAGADGLSSTPDAGHPPAAPLPGTAGSFWHTAPAAGFSLAVWDGYVRVPSTGAFSFQVQCDGPCSLEVEGAHIAGVMPEDMATATSSSTRLHTRTAAPMHLLGGQTYRVRLSLQQWRNIYSGEADASAVSGDGASAGKLQLLWQVTPSETSTVAAQLTAAVSAPAPVPLTTQFWSGDHVLGSPVPVWLY